MGGIGAQEEIIRVIIPVYNVAPYLSRCIESVLNQTYSNLEIIIVDDASTDGSEQICDDYKKKDTRITVFHVKHGGQSNARNLGLQHANGDYVTFVDADDYIATDMYDKLYENMGNEVDIVCCGRRCITTEGKSYNAYCIGAKRKFSNVEAIEELLLHRGISFSVCTKLFRKKLFQDIKFPVGKNSEDLPVTYSLIKKSKNILHIGGAKYYNFYRENSTSSHFNDMRWMDYVIFVRDILLDVKANYPQLEKQAEARYLLNAIITLNGICESGNNYGRTKIRLIKMLKRMWLRGVLNPYIQVSNKKVLLQLVLTIKKNL